MKKLLVFASSLALLFACSEEKQEASYNKCPQASSEDVQGTATDAAGNTYKTVKIGDNEWFAENLKTTQLNDGTPIASVQENEQWANASAPASAVYGEEILYNYAAVESGKLCPEGWTVPTETEWLQLAATYAGVEDASAWDKVPTTIGWDSTSFAAVAAGFREANGNFYKAGDLGLWWTSTEHNEANAMYVFMKNIGSDAKKYVGINKSHINRAKGLSVRCVRKYDAANAVEAPQPEEEMPADTTAPAADEATEL